jgi:hypothetical protein
MNQEHVGKQMGEIPQEEAYAGSVKSYAKWLQTAAANQAECL